MKTSSAESAPAAGLPNSRYFHLDALRAGLMFWGVLVYTSTLDTTQAPDFTNWFFHACAEISGLVRMEAFFLISGFLAYMLLRKYGIRRMLSRRPVSLGLPLAAGLVLLNPLTNFLIYIYHNDPISFGDYLAGMKAEAPRGPMIWHLHLWFLILLLVYLFLAPVIARAVDSGVRWVATRWSQLPGELHFLAIAAAVAGACLASRIGFEICKPVLPGASHYVIRSLGNFLPYYALGMLLFASPGLRDSSRRPTGRRPPLPARC